MENLLGLKVWRLSKPQKGYEWPRMKYLHLVAVAETCGMRSA